MGWFALSVTRPQCMLNRCLAKRIRRLAAAELGKRERWRCCDRLVIEVSPSFAALWRGYGQWILRRNAGDGWPWGEFRLCCEFRGGVYPGWWMTRLRRRSKLARPYICLLIILIRVTLPST